MNHALHLSNDGKMYFIARDGEIMPGKNSLFGTGKHLADLFQGEELLRAQRGLRAHVQDLDDAERKKTEKAKTSRAKTESKPGNERAKSTKAEPQPEIPAEPKIIDGRTILNADEKDLQRITSETLAALALHNEPPRLFVYAAQPSRMEADDEGAPIIRPLDVDKLRYEIGNSILFKKGGHLYYETKYPPQVIIRNCLAAPDFPFPLLNRIVTAPVFSQEGEIETAPGYSKKSKTYFYNRDKISITQIDKKPTGNQIVEALKIYNEITVDFPFKDTASRTHAAGLFVLPFARDLIPGPTPAALVKSSTPGTGKTLLVESLLCAGNGGMFTLISPAKDDDEWRKRLTSAVLLGRDIMIDNVETLVSSSLAAMLTATQWSDRLLGSTRIISAPVRNLFTVTANNPILSNELTRRVLPITLEAQNERPWERENFKHKNLRGWVKDQRRELIEAALIIIQHWIASGKPKPKARPLGTYEEFSHVIGGILELVGMTGFLKNSLELYETADPQGAALRILVNEWSKQYGSGSVKTADLYEIAGDIDDLLIFGKNDTDKKKSFGRLIAKNENRIFERFKITRAGTSSKSVLWRLLDLENPEGDELDFG